MGLHFKEKKSGFRNKSDVALFHRLGCKICPLKDHPGRMASTGTDNPLIYILGEAPGRNEIEEGKQFVGVSGRLLREYIPQEFIRRIRWNNVVNSHPPKNRDPAFAEIESCRPRVVGDIERTKPRAIFGFGNVPLDWVSGFTGITYWRGRKMPVQIGTHKCWYYPMLHPSYLARNRRNNHDAGSEDERMTAFDLKRAFDEVESLPDPEPHSPEQVRENVKALYSIREIEQALMWASKQPFIGLDYETNAIRPYVSGAKILTGAVGTIDQAYAWAFDHPQAQWTTQERKDLTDLWLRFLERAKCVKVVHNLAFELEWTGVIFGQQYVRAGKWEDTMSAAAILDSRKGKSKPGCFSLEFLIQQYYGVNIKKIDTLNKANLAGEPLAKVLSYNGADAKYHHGLWLKQEREIEAQGLWEPYELALRKVPTFTIAQIRGVPVNQQEVQRLKNKYDTRIDGIVEKIKGLEAAKKYERVRGKPYDPASSKETIYLLYEIYKRDECETVDKYSKEKKYSADESVLTAIIETDTAGSPEADLAKALIDYRQAWGNRSKYVLSLAEGSEESVIFPDHLIHAQFNTVFAETGRISCVREGTRIQVPGGTKAIEDIRIGDWVYCFDSERRLALRKVTNTWFRGFKKVVRLHWIGKGGKNSGYLDVTPDHRVRLVDGEYQGAGQFLGGVLVTSGSARHIGRRQRGEHVMALSRGRKAGRNFLYATGNGGGLVEARFVFEQVNGWSPEHVHHDDENKLNDLPSNLIGMSRSEHISYHARLLATPEEMRRRSASRSSETIERTQTAAARAKAVKAEQRFSKQQIIDALVTGKGIRGACRILSCDYSSIRSRIDKWEISPLLWDGRTHRTVRPERRRKLHPYKGHTNYVSKHNHMIQRIEHLDGQYPVYDLEVEGAHNFIANEICVHNCESPNLQNFPKRDDESKELRGSVQAALGCLILAADYGQIEARVFAMASKDKTFCKALWERYDVHKAWAERIATEYPSRIGGRKMLTDKKAMKDFRTDIKNQWTFPLFFGARLESVSGYLKIPVEVLRPCVKAFKKEFEGVFAWQEEVEKFYKQHGYVECLNGRRRHGPLSLNQLINAPIQGTAGEIVQDAMARLSETQNPLLQPEIQIHDDLTYLRIPEDRYEEAAEQMIDMMVNVPFSWVNVPITIEVSVGANWAPYDAKTNPNGLKEVGAFSSDDWKK